MLLRLTGGEVAVIWSKRERERERERREKREERERRETAFQ